MLKLLLRSICFASIALAQWVPVVGIKVTTVLEQGNENRVEVGQFSRSSDGIQVETTPSSTHWRNLATGDWLEKHGNRVRTIPGVPWPPDYWLRTKRKAAGEPRLIQNLECYPFAIRDRRGARIGTAWRSLDYGLEVLWQTPAFRIELTEIQLGVEPPPEALEKPK